MRYSQSFLLIALMCTPLGVGADPANPGAKWQYAVYTERSGTDGRTYEWEEMGRATSAKTITAVLRYLGFNRSEFSEASLAGFLNSVSQHGWELAHVVQEAGGSTVRYVFRMPLQPQPSVPEATQYSRALKWALAHSAPNWMAPPSSNVSVSVTDYATLVTNGASQVQANIRIRNTSNATIWTDGFPPMYQREFLVANEWEFRPTQWVSSPRRALEPDATADFHVLVRPDEPPKRLLLLFHSHPSLESATQSFAVYTPQIQYPKPRRAEPAARANSE